MSDDEFQRMQLRRFDYCQGRAHGYYEGRLDGFPVGALAVVCAALLERLELLLLGVLLILVLYVKIARARP